MQKFKIYASLIAAVLIAVFIAQNTAVVETKVLFVTIAMPRAALLAVTLLIGVVIGFVLALNWGRQKKPTDPSEPSH